MPETSKENLWTWLWTHLPVMTSTALGALLLWHVYVTVTRFGEYDRAMRHIKETAKTDRDAAKTDRDAAKTDRDAAKTDRDAAHQERADTERRILEVDRVVFGLVQRVGFAEPRLAAAEAHLEKEGLRVVLELGGATVQPLPPTSASGAA